MSGKTSIGWTDLSWNPVVGCTRVTAGCDGCYAFALHDRRHAIYQANNGRWSPGGRVMPAQYARPFSELQLIPERLTWPLTQKKPQRIFRQLRQPVLLHVIVDSRAVVLDVLAQLPVDADHLVNGFAPFITTVIAM